MDLNSGLPFSLIRHGLPYSYPKIDKSIKTDIVIIGGGISGALTGYFLNQAGFKCTIVDGRTIGLGSTCASTSLLQYEIDVPLHKLEKMRGKHDASRAYILCKEAIDKLESISRKIGFKEFESKDSLYFAAHKKDVGSLQKEYTMRKSNGFKVEYLGESEIIKQFGFTSPGAILSHHGAQTDAYAFSHALHQYGMDRGLKVYDRTFISKISPHKKSVELKTESGFTISARKVIYATGYEIKEFIEKKLVKLHATYATISENDASKNLLWKNALLWNTADPYLYMRMTTGGRILVGGRDENFYNPSRRDKLLNRKTNSLVKDFSKLFPDISFKSEFSWTGTFGSTADGLPFIGTYSKKPHSYFALGFGGNGITFSLIAAEIITDHLLGKKSPDAGIFAFDRL